ncbi:S-layer homology domain-containing protein, partial [Demequina activiva]|uniref:S-layer homology domain-containing protein n=1 Tax=Demequina activiva TaxID=1582364 RepID=UPI00194334AB
HIEWLADSGITSGYANGRFGPSDAVTRGQMAAFLYKGSTALHGDDDTMYKVGKDIFPGTYVAQQLTPDAIHAYCEISRYADDDGAPGERLFVYGRPGQTIVTIQPTDGYFTYDGCTGWVPLRPSSPNASTFGPGTHAVGYHMRPGTYRAPGGPGCEYRHWDDAIEHSTEFGWTTGGGYLQLELPRGRFVWSVSCGTFTRVGDVVS